MIIKSYKGLRDYLSTFNYKEGTETVTFGEAVKVEKSSDMSARGAPHRSIKLLSLVLFLFVWRSEGLQLYLWCTFRDLDRFWAIYYSASSRNGR